MPRGVYERKPFTKEHKRKMSEARTKHGGKGTRLYKIWCQMKQRCNNPKQLNYKYYGSRGVAVCDDWLHDFTAFRDYALSHGYQDNLTIDRINGGNYEPGNVQFIPLSENIKKRFGNTC